MLPFPHAFFPRIEANIQVCASAEHLPSSGDDHASNAIVYVKHREDANKLILYNFGKGIVVFRPIECHEHDGRRSG